MTNVAAEMALTCGVNTSCQLVSGFVDVGDNIGYTTHGILIADGDGRVRLRFDDISADKDEVLTLIDLLKRHQVPLLHVKDVLDDYLIELASV